MWYADRMPKRDYKITVSKPYAQMFAIEAVVVALLLGVLAIFMSAGVGDYVAVLVLLCMSLVLLIGSHLLTAYIKVSGLSSRQTRQPDHSRPAEAGSERTDAQLTKVTALPKPNSEG